MLLRTVVVADFFGRYDFAVLPCGWTWQKLKQFVFRGTTPSGLIFPLQKAVISLTTPELSQFCTSVPLYLLERSC